MRIQADSLNTASPARRNGKNPSNNLVSLQEAFSRAIRVSDGSIYEPVPAIELIAEMTARELPFAAPEASTHVRVSYSGGPDRYVSFSPRTFEEKDDYRTFLAVELGRVYVDGIEIEPGNLAIDLDEALEEWVLADRRGE
jgi:hypothetical protein